MPSPFPGMDPFLEHAGVFPDLHDSLIYCLREALNARLAPPYFASANSRVWMESASRHAGPDVNVLRGVKRESQPGRLPLGGSVALAEKSATRPVIVHVWKEEVRESYLEIYADPGQERLVTSIEVLSLSNKTKGTQGRKLYLRKQREILHAKVNLVEIDLLRGGEHSTAVPRSDAEKQALPFDYHVCVRAFDMPHDFRFYPIDLREELPAIEIPLLPGDSPVVLDLQPLLDRCYETGQYARRVQYDAWQISPPLSSEQAAWAEQLLGESR